MQFKIKTLAVNGHVLEEIVEGKGVAEVRAALLVAGRVVISVRPAWTGLRFRKGGKSREIQLIFCDQLKTLLLAGISIPESLQALRDSERDALFRAVLSDTMACVEMGQPLSQALAEHPEYFPSVLVSMLSSAEKTGALADALARYGNFQRQFDEFRNNLWAAATYPLMLLGAGGCVVLFLLFYVVPRFSLVYRDMHGPLPWTARMLLAWGDFADGRAGLLLITAVLMLGFLAGLLSRPEFRARFTARLEKLPWVGALFREIQLAHYFHGLSLLLNAGIPLSRSLELSRDLLSRGMRSASDAVSQSVVQGGRLSVGLERHGLVTPVALRLIQAGERSGQLGEMLSEAAAFHDRRILHTTTLLSRVAGPLLMALMGLLIGGIVVLLYMPIFQLADGLG